MKRDSWCFSPAYKRHFYYYILWELLLTKCKKKGFLQAQSPCHQWARAKVWSILPLERSNVNIVMIFASFIKTAIPFWKDAKHIYNQQITASSSIWILSLLLGTRCRALTYGVQKFLLKLLNLFNNRNSLQNNLKLKCVLFTL